MENSLTNIGKVLELYVSKSDGGGRINQKEILVDLDGVIGDKFYAKDPLRSVLLTSIESYIMAEKEDIDLSHGVLGENILVDYNPYLLPSGTRLSIGTVVLEISQGCTLCKSLTKIDSKLPKLLKNDRGVFVKVIKGGTIHTGDIVQIAN